MFEPFKAGVAIVVMSTIAALAPPAKAAISGQLQPRLIDQNGHRFVLPDLRGRPLIVTFVDAHCTQACPLINARFARAQDLFAQQHLDARLLTITLDPEHDSPAVMRELAQRFGADSRRWLLASGPPRDVRTIMREFRVVAGDEHTTFVYVFDRNGALRDRLLASSILETQLAVELHVLASGKR